MASQKPYSSTAYHISVPGKWSLPAMTLERVDNVFVVDFLKTNQTTSLQLFTEMTVGNFISYGA